MVFSRKVSYILCRLCRLNLNVQSLNRYIASCYSISKRMSRVRKKIVAVSSYDITGVIVIELSTELLKHNFVFRLKMTPSLFDCILHFNN